MILSHLSLKTHSIAFQYKLPDSKWIRFCYMNDQIITWTSESREVIFWHLFQQVPAGALKLPSLVREEHAQINNRNVLVLQTQLSKSFLLIDVTNRSVLKTISNKSYRLVSALDIDRFIYLLYGNDFHEIRLCQLYNYRIDEEFNLQDERFYKSKGYSPKFACLEKGGLISLTDGTKAYLVDFDTEEAVEKLHSRGNKFDASMFVRCSKNKLVASITEENAIWIWKY